MTLTVTKFDLTEMNPAQGQFQGPPTHLALPSFVKLVPRTWEIYKYDHWAPTTLTFAETNP
jgi:hypothetical protein